MYRLPFAASASSRKMLGARRRTPSFQIAKSIIAYPMLTVAYTVSGKLGLMLAVPPGYASPIFPAAGIAVTAAMIAGRATLPWIFLGSFLLNLWTGRSQLAATLRRCGNHHRRGFDAAGRHRRRDVAACDRLSRTPR